MSSFIITLLISALAVYITALILPGIKIKSYWTALGVALLLGFLNAVVQPILVLLTIPITILTFGLFLFIIDALVILIVDKLFSNFEVKNFWWALLFSLFQSTIVQLIDFLLF